MLKPESEPSRRVHLLDLHFDAVTLRACGTSILSDVLNHRGGWVSTVNVAILMMMRSDPKLDEYVRRSRLVLADGQPIVWLSRLLGIPLPERVSGVDLLELLCARAAQLDLGVYMIGGSAEVILDATTALRGRYPDLDLCSHEGYFAPEEADAVAATVVESGARLVFVGMGVPRQEYWISNHLRPNEHGMVAVGVGGSLDVIAGLRKRAPRTLQVLGLEWVFRLAQEPRRLWRRYLTTGWDFLLLAVPAALKARATRPGRSPAPPTKES